jgi:glutamine synthetase
LPEALDALKENESFCNLIHHDVVDRQIAVKKAELTLLQGMSGEERRQWVIARF